MLDNVLNIINNIVIILVVITLSFQMIYSLFIFIPYKKYKMSNKNHKYAVVVAARNEELVIGNLIKSIRKAKYPQELLDIFIIAHNCTDKTKEIAESLGAIVIECNDDNPKHKTKGYALKAGFEIILKDYQHEGYFMFDADNLVSKDFFSKMNDAFDSGVKVCYGFRNSKNLQDNCVAGVNGMYFLRDSMFNSHARTILHSSCIIGGAGFLFAREIIEKEGWTAVSLDEGAEFSMQYVLKGYHAYYVGEAMFYDEQPTDFRIAMHRQARVARGTFGLFCRNAHKFLFKFFTKFKYMYLDMFFNFFYGPISLLCVTWFPFYYTYLPVKMIIAGDMVALNNYLLMILQMVTLCILLPITIQNIILYIAEWKRLKIKSFKKVVTSILFFPIYNMACCVATAFGILNPKLRWKQVVHDKAIDIENIENTN